MRGRDLTHQKVPCAHFPDFSQSLMRGLAGLYGHRVQRMDVDHQRELALLGQAVTLRAGGEPLLGKGVEDDAGAGRSLFGLGHGYDSSRTDASSARCRSSGTATRTTCRGHNFRGGAAIRFLVRRTARQSSCRYCRRPQCKASHDKRIPGPQFFHGQIRPRYLPLGSARKTSPPRFKACARPWSRRPSRARGARSASSVTVTRTSASFGSGFSVVNEPIRAIRVTPATCRAASAKASTSAIRKLRTDEFTDLLFMDNPLSEKRPDSSSANSLWRYDSLALWLAFFCTSSCCVESGVAPRVVAAVWFSVPVRALAT